MKRTSKELALGGMFAALGVVLLCLGGSIPLALYVCPILASAVLLPVRERRALRLPAKLLLAAFAVGADYLFLLFVLRLDAVTQELAETAPAVLWATCALGLALFLLYDLTLSRLTILYRRRRTR